MNSWRAAVPIVVTGIGLVVMIIAEAPPWFMIVVTPIIYFRARI